MPTLPTFDVTQSVADRILAAFTGRKDENGVTLTPVKAYRRWLRSNLIEEVTMAEAEDDKTQLQSDLVV